MARPRKEGLDYFSHDTNASNNEKIELIRAAHKNDGYAFYFISLERINDTAKGKLSLKSMEEKKVHAKKVGVSIKRFDKILENCFKYGLFDEKEFQENKCLTSNGVQKRFSKTQRERKRKRRIYNKDSDEDYLDSPIVSPIVSPRETPRETTQSKVKESKEEEIKEKESKIKYEVENNAPTFFINKEDFIKSLYIKYTYIKKPNNNAYIKPILGVYRQYAKQLDEGEIDKIVEHQIKKRVNVTSIWREHIFSDIKIEIGGVIDSKAASRSIQHKQIEKKNSKHTDEISELARTMSV